MLSSSRKDEDRPPVAAWCRNSLRNLCVKTTPPWTTNFWINLCKSFRILSGSTCFLEINTTTRWLFRKDFSYIFCFLPFGTKHELNRSAEFRCFIENFELLGIMISATQALGKITLWDGMQVGPWKKMVGFTGKNLENIHPGNLTAGTPKCWNGRWISSITWVMFSFKTLVFGGVNFGGALQKIDFHVPSKAPANKLKTLNMPAGLHTV